MPTCEDQTYHEQQIEILLASAMEMNEFPAEDFLRHGEALGWNQNVQVIHPEADYTSYMHISTVIKQLTSLDAYLLWDGITVVDGPWKPVADVAEQWFLEHMSVDDAREIFEHLTGKETRADPPRRLNLKLAVHCGIKAGLPREVVCEEDQHSSRPIEAVVRTCHHFFPIEIEVMNQAYLRGDNPGYIDVSVIRLDGCTFTVGPWHTLFQLYQAWWSTGPILPELPAVN